MCLQLMRIKQAWYLFKKPPKTFFPASRLQPRGFYSELEMRKQQIYVEKNGRKNATCWKHSRCSGLLFLIFLRDPILSLSRRKESLFCKKNCGIGRIRTRISIQLMFFQLIFRAKKNNTPLRKGQNPDMNRDPYVIVMAYYDPNITG